jgi:5-methylcytosine-specific restriction endonuclease McrA
MSVRVMSWVWESYGPEHFAPPQRGRDVPIEWRRANPFDLAKRDGWLCAYCGTPLEIKEGCRDDPAKQAATVDHVVPRAAGGGDTNLNCVLACLGCNVRKGARHPSMMRAGV